VRAETEPVDRDLRSLAELTGKFSDAMGDAAMSRRLPAIAEYVRQLALANAGSCGDQ
jgi:hypothetical protein